MKKTSFIIIFTLGFPLNALSNFEQSIESRVEHLEKMARNPVLLQLSRRVEELTLQIQGLQDENDRLARSIRNIKKKQDDQYKETDDRLTELLGKINSKKKD